MQFEQELPGCWAARRLSDSAWAVVAPNPNDDDAPGARIVRIISRGEEVYTTVVWFITIFVIVCLVAFS